MENPEFLESVGEGAFYSDEENHKSEREPYPDEVWDEELNDAERGGE